MLNPLQKTGHAHLDEFVEIVRRNCQELHPLQQWIPDISRLFQHAPIELQPLQVPVEIETRIVECSACHKLSLGTQSDNAAVLRADECFLEMVSSQHRFEVRLAAQESLDA